MSRAKEMRDLPSAIDVTASGNVGIGITPASPLHINMGTDKNIQFSGDMGGMPGGVTGLHATNDASSGLRSMGMRATTLRFATGSNERMRIDENGNVIIGSSTAETTISGGSPALQVIGSGFNSYLAAVRRDTSQYASGIALVKSRNTSVGSYTIVQDNDQLGSILFIGDDGTDLDTYGATISARVNGTPGANNMPVDIEFSTNSGTGSPTLNLKLTKDGVLEGASDAEIKTSPIRIHSNTISTNTTVDTNENAVSGGPVTIATGVTVTVNGDWTVV